MCQNAMRYNAPDTVYFTEARRLLSYGLKLLSKEKLMVMRGNFEFMRGITLEQMGLTVKVGGGVFLNCDRRQVIPLISHLFCFCQVSIS